MSSYKSSLAFLIVFISLYCAIMLGTPELEAKHLESSNDSQPIHADTQKERDSLAVEENGTQTTAGDNKAIQTPVIEYQPPTTVDMSDISIQTPDSNSDVIITEKEEPYTSEHEENKYPQEIAHPNEDGRPIVPAEEALSDTTTTEQENILVTPTPILSITPTGNEQSLIEEEKAIHTPSPDGELSQAIPIEKETPYGGEEHPGDESSIEEVQPQHVIITESHRDTEEKSILSVIPATTPEYAAASVDAEESLVLIEKDKPSHDGEGGSPAIPMELLPFAHIESSSHVKEEREAGLPTKDTGESTTGIASEEHRIDTVKEVEGSGHAWEIWHKDPTHGVILAVVIILIAAKIAEWLARRLRLPGVVGKLIIGMILGNVITFTGWDFFDFLRTMPFVKMISYFGTLILLFTAGLNTDLRALLRVGTSSLLVCLGGIIVPAGLGLMVGHFLLPDTSSGTKLLLAIILCNSSTGLLLAVLSELKAINTLEGRVIAGATILTDIVVILTFGVVSGFVVKGGGSLVGMSVSFGIAITSLIISLIAILKYGDKFGNFLTRRLTEGLNIPIVVILSLLLAFMFGSVGLHTVIGAFVAGLFLRNVKLRNSDDGEHRNVESFVRPFYMLLVPILFVRVGAQVELESFLNLNAVLLGLAITGAAIIGKMFCSVCPIEKGINRLAIGIGMATKMEGTLILAGLGRDMGMLNDTIFSSVIMAIVFTSIVCPSLLRNILIKKGGSREILPVTKEKKELEGAVLN